MEGDRTQHSFPVMCFVLFFWGGGQAHCLSSPSLYLLSNCLSIGLCPTDSLFQTPSSFPLTSHPAHLPPLISFCDTLSHFSLSFPVAVFSLTFLPLLSAPCLLISTCSLFPSFLSYNSSLVVVSFFSPTLVHAGVHSRFFSCVERERIAEL